MAKMEKVLDSNENLCRMCKGVIYWGFRYDRSKDILDLFRSGQNDFKLAEIVSRFSNNRIDEPTF